MSRQVILLKRVQEALGQEKNNQTKQQQKCLILKFHLELYISFQTGVIFP